jgi:hypothetical protein
MTYIKKNDIVYCKETFFEPSYKSNSSLKNFFKNNKLTHVEKGNFYKVLAVSEGYISEPLMSELKSSKIAVINDFGAYFWYDESRFEKLIDIRKRKLNKLECLKSEI